MRYLLDTHVLLWILSDPNRVVPSTLARLRDPHNTIFFSVASAWEMEIKRNLGKLETPDDLDLQLRQIRIDNLPIRLDHIRSLRALPPLHRDPFDRMLIAQAQTDDLIIVTADPLVLAYPVKTLPA